MDERIDVLDELGRFTGEIAWKSEAHRLGLWHRCFHCWIFGSDSAGPYLLVQRRAAAKDTWPGYLDVTAAGHLAAGEEPLDGLRELEEELGLRVSPDSLIPLGTRRAEQEIPAGRDREFHEVYLLRDATPARDLRLQREEVASVVRISLEAAEGLRPGGSAPAEEFVDGESLSIAVGLSDFVPNEDGYLPRVARAARVALTGVRPARLF